METIFRKILENPGSSEKNVKMRNERGETVLIYYLKKYQTRPNCEIIPTVEKLVAVGVPTNVIDDNGISALDLLISRMSTRADVWDEKIRTMISLVKNPPVNVMVRLCSKYFTFRKRHLDRNNPIRRLVCLLVQKFDFNKVVHTAQETTKTNG